MFPKIRPRSYNLEFNIDHMCTTLLFEFVIGVVRESAKGLLAFRFAEHPDSFSVDGRDGGLHAREFGVKGARVFVALLHIYRTWDGATFNVAPIEGCEEHVPPDSLEIQPLGRCPRQQLCTQVNDECFLN